MFRSCPVKFTGHIFLLLYAHSLKDDAMLRNENKLREGILQAQRTGKAGMN